MTHPAEKELLPCCRGEGPCQAPPDIGPCDPLPSAENDVTRCACGCGVRLPQETDPRVKVYASPNCYARAIRDAVPPAPGTPQNPVDGATHPCPTPGYAGHHTAVGAGAISPPYVCHGCGSWFLIPPEVTEADRG